MKKLFGYLVVAVALLFGATSCYDSVTQDYTYSASYFAQQQPIRTVLADRDGLAEANAIKVGAAVGGKLEVDQDDWVKFAIDETLLTEFVVDDGSSDEDTDEDTDEETTALPYVLLPESYYSFSNSDNMMYISKSNNLITDIQIDFTDAFFNDPLAATEYYALPFQLLETSCDQINDGMDYSIVVVKFQNKCHGTYYVQGSVTEMADANTATDNVVTYSADDLSANITVDISTLERSKSLYPVGQTLTVVEAADAVTDDEGIVITPAVTSVSVVLGNVTMEYLSSGAVSMGAGEENLQFISGSGKYTYDNDSEECVIEIMYLFESDGVIYQVEETLTRRQDPLLDLRVETWSI